jgi:arylsulfatase A-like enzyme
MHGKFGFEQGFGAYHNEFGEEGEDLTGQIDVSRDGTLHSRADRINERAFSLLDSAESRKQFFWFHYFDAHAPYGKWEDEESTRYPRIMVRRIKKRPEEAAYIVQTSREKYDQDVRQLDEALDELFTRLEADADRWATHVVVVSDHGEAFGEGGALGHGKRLVAPQIHVPLFLLSPRVEPGSRSEPVGSIDVAPTLLSLAGVPAELPGGRDLTASLDADERVYGMRRTFAEPHEEFRTDGTTHMLDPFLFFAVDDDRLLVGNRARLSRGDSNRTVRNDELADELTALFGEFEDQVTRLAPKEITDPDVLAALEKLGYTGL